MLRNLLECDGEEGKYGALICTIGRGVVCGSSLHTCSRQMSHIQNNRWSDRRYHRGESVRQDTIVCTGAIVQLDFEYVTVRESILEVHSRIIE